MKHKHPWFLFSVDMCHEVYFELCSLKLLQSFSCDILIEIYFVSFISILPLRNLSTDTLTQLREQIQYRWRELDSKHLIISAYFGHIFLYVLD